MKRFVILISGRGSNMRALIESDLPGLCVAVISNRADAEGLDWAHSNGFATEIIEDKNYSQRSAFDAALLACLSTYQPDLILFAGFMRIVGNGIVSRYPCQMLNIHPSLLPAFPGLHTHKQALAAGVKLHGCTVHFIDSALDTGAIVAQAAVPVLADDDAAALAARVLIQEHLLYPKVARWFLEGRLRMVNGCAKLSVSSHEAMQERNNQNALIAPNIY